MNLFKKIFILAVAFFTINSESFAIHIAGGNSSYSCTGDPNEFLITITMYRDCSGVSAPSAPNIVFSNTCSLPNPSSLILSLQSSSEVSQICTPEVPNSKCASGYLPGMQEYI